MELKKRGRREDGGEETVVLTFMGCGSNKSGSRWACCIKETSGNGVAGEILLATFSRRRFRFLSSVPT